MFDITGPNGGKWRAVNGSMVFILLHCRLTYGQGLFCGFLYGVQAPRKCPRPPGGPAPWVQQLLPPVAQGLAEVVQQLLPPVAAADFTPKGRIVF